MKVLLLNPIGRVLIGRDGVPAERKHCTPPLGLAYLAASIRHYFPVSVIDALGEGYETERRRGEFLYYGLTDDEILSRIAIESPLVIGVSILFSNLAAESMRLISLIKSEQPDVKIVLGGHHPSAMPELIMRNYPCVDFIIKGEADLTFLQLLLALDRRVDAPALDEISGLVYRSEGGVTIQSDRCKVSEYKGVDFQYYSKKNSPNPTYLDRLPYPAWDLFPLEAYWSTNVRMGAGETFRKNYGVMVSTRGCPHICDFCTSPLMGGFKNYRKRTNEDVIDEINYLNKTYGIDEIQFLDDNFFVSRSRVKDLLRQMATKCTDMLFSVPAGTEANTLDEEVISLLYPAGFRRITLAIESGNTEIQDNRIDKNVDLSRVPQTIKLLRDQGIEVRAFFMIGFPGETRAQIQNTADYALSLDLDDFALSVVSPLPGTPLYDEVSKLGLLRKDFDPNDIRYSVSAINISGISSEEIEMIRRSTWIKHQEKKRRGNMNLLFKDHKEFSNAGFRTINN
jgi:anaerobic magnesium-protoporphyrin IX monomethyl ester cyclase